MNPLRNDMFSGADFTCRQEVCQPRTGEESMFEAAEEEGTASAETYSVRGGKAAVAVAAMLVSFSFAPFVSQSTNWTTTPHSAHRSNAANFEEVAARWWMETAIMSSHDAMKNTDTFDELVAMGEPAIPLLLQKMTEQRGWWSLALAEITGEDPVADSSKGQLDEITEDWLKWGREHGYV